MFDDACRWLYWSVWRRLPSHADWVARRSPEFQATYHEAHARVVELQQRLGI